MPFDAPRIAQDDLIFLQYTGGMILMAEAGGFRMGEVQSANGQGQLVRAITAYAEDGSIGQGITTIAAPDGSSVVTGHDEDGDGARRRLSRLSERASADCSVVVDNSSMYGRRPSPITVIPTGQGIWKPCGTTRHGVQLTQSSWITEWMERKVKK